VNGVSCRSRGKRRISTGIAEGQGSLKRSASCAQIAPNRPRQIRADQADAFSNDGHRPHGRIGCASSVHTEAGNRRRQETTVSERAIPGTDGKDRLPILSNRRSSNPIQAVSRPKPTTRPAARSLRLPGPRRACHLRVAEPPLQITETRVVPDARTASQRRLASKSPQFGEISDWEVGDPCF
jgi:hypothetical protein